MNLLSPNTLVLYYDFMEHIVFGYKLILLIIGILTLFMAFLVKSKVNYLKAFIYFYLIYVLIIVLDLLRSYLIISSFWESVFAIFISYAISLFLNFSLIFFAYKIGASEKKVIGWRVLLILSISYLVAVSPLSIYFDSVNKTVTVKLFYYLSLLSLISIGGISTILQLKRIPNQQGFKDKIFLSTLSLFIAFIFSESIISLVISMANPVNLIGIPDRNVQLSTIPFLLLSLAGINLFISKIMLNSKVKNLDDYIEMGFSQRESEILLLVAKGFSNKKIADELCISISTVKTHMNNIFKKSSVNSRFELLKMIE